MNDWYHIKPVSKICPGYLTKVVASPGFSAERTKSERDVPKRKYSIHYNRDYEGSYTSMLRFTEGSPAKFEIHISNVQLTEDCLNYIHQQLGINATLKVAWKFLDFDKNLTPPENLSNVKVIFDSIYVYTIYLTDELINALNRKKITFEMYGANIEKQICLGKGRAPIGNIWEQPEGRKIRVELFDYYIARQGQEKPKPSARLEVYFKITCDSDVLKSIKNKFKVQYSDQDIPLYNMQSAFEMQQDSKISATLSKTVMPTDSEINNFEEALDLVLTRNKALRTTQSEISNELKDRTQWLRVEADWRRTLQEHAILSGKNPHDIKWRQWRDEFTAHVNIRTYPDFPPHYKPVLTIVVVKMILFEDSPPMVNEDMTQFYIEYSFLGYDGPEMETPESIQKTNEGEGFEFDFMKKFPIDLQENHQHCRELAAFIKDGKNLTFNVISEPEEDESVPIQACEQVGFCEVNMFETTQLETNLAAYWFDINDISNPKEVIGYIKIQLDGIQAMRKMALEMLAPPDYDIIQ